MVPLSSSFLLTTTVHPTPLPFAYCLQKKVYLSHGQGLILPPISCHFPTQRPRLQPALMAFPSPGCPPLFPHKLQSARVSVPLLKQSLPPVLPFPATLSNQPCHFSQPRSSPIFPTRLLPAPEGHKNLTSKPAADDGVCNPDLPFHAALFVLVCVHHAHTCLPSVCELLRSPV